MNQWLKLAVYSFIAIIFGTLLLGTLTSGSNFGNTGYGSGNQNNYGYSYEQTMPSHNGMGMGMGMHGGMGMRGRR